MVSTFRELKDSKQLNCTMPTLQLVTSTSVIKHTNNIDRGTMYTVSELTKPNDSEKQNFIRFNLPSNFNLVEQQASGFYIKVPSNALRLGTVNLMKDHSLTQGCAQNNNFELIVNSNQSDIANKDSVIKRVDSQPVLKYISATSQHRNGNYLLSTFPIRVHSTGIADCKICVI